MTTPGCESESTLTVAAWSCPKTCESESITTLADPPACAVEVTTTVPLPKNMPKALKDNLNDSPGEIV